MSNPSDAVNDGVSTSITKGIGSLAQKSNNITTRGGSKKLKFTPTLPSRRTVTIKSEANETRKEEMPSSSTPAPRGCGRGRGRGRGGSSSHPSVEMTASGPFAMGPSAMAGSMSSRSRLRAGTATVPSSGPSTSNVALEHTNFAAPKLQPSKANVKVEEEEAYREVYSDPEENGVEIIDMNLVKDMDWSAPDILKRSSKGVKLKKGSKEEGMKEVEDMQVDPTNALDLGGSEEEEEEEDLHEYFARQQDENVKDSSHFQKLYFFQFPLPFPTFSAEEAATDSLGSTFVVKENNPGKHVSFAADTKIALSLGDEKDKKRKENPLMGEARNSGVSGHIGQLEVYESGAAKIRLGDNMLYDVTAAVSSSFFQQAVNVDSTTKRMTALGEVNQRFVVSPNIEQLLEEVERTRLTDSGG